MRRMKLSQYDLKCRIAFECSARRRHFDRAAGCTGWHLSLDDEGSNPAVPEVLHWYLHLPETDWVKTAGAVVVAVNPSPAQRIVVCREPWA